MKIPIKKYLVRLLIVSLISFAVVLIFSEVAFYFQNDRSLNRSPTTVEIVIPAGTAQKVASGEELPSIPNEMVFVLGDVLVVKNEDSVTHQLGPLYIPAGSTAALPLNESDNFTLGCSFQNNRYLGMDVRQPTTLATRLFALFTAGPATILFVFLNSLIFFPIKQEEKQVEVKE
jgi:hypothetical protein